MFSQGANILVDNKGCIKLADFGASKQVAELVSQKIICFLQSILQEAFCSVYSLIS
jgi:serine/threonine protein kinase